jgi:hypothetical protein
MAFTASVLSTQPQRDHRDDPNVLFLYYEELGGPSPVRAPGVWPGLPRTTPLDREDCLHGRPIVGGTIFLDGLLSG